MTRIELGSIKTIRDLKTNRGVITFKTVTTDKENRTTTQHLARVPVVKGQLVADAKRQGRVKIMSAGYTPIVRPGELGGDGPGKIVEDKGTYFYEVEIHAPKAEKSK